MPRSWLRTHLRRGYDLAERALHELQDASDHADDPTTAQDLVRLRAEVREVQGRVQRLIERHGEGR